MEKAMRRDKAFGLSVLGADALKNQAPSHNSSELMGSM